MIIESLEDVIRYLNGTYSAQSMPSIKDSRTYRLEREQQLLDLLHNPEKELTFIHVAGSKGKGTTAAYIASLLGGGKTRVGLYMSPHVYDYRERWMLSDCTDKPISFFKDEEYVKAANIMQTFLGDHKKINLVGNVPPTQFELYTAFAFVLFRTTGINVAVIETGLGGRLDATNVITPIANVITHIEKEHTDVLGDDIRGITAEKCGIIKDKVPVFALKGSKEVNDVIISECKKHSSPLTFVEQNVKTNTLSPLSIKSRNAYVDYTLALTTVESLYSSLPSSQIDRAIALTLPARCEVTLENNKIIILDGAHTSDSIRDLTTDIEAIVQNVRPDDLFDTQGDPQLSRFLNDKTFKEVIPSINKYAKAAVFSCTENKDAEGMLEVLFKNYEIVAITKIDGYKKSNMREIVLAAERVINKLKTKKVKKIIINDDINICLTEIEDLYYCGEIRKEARTIVVTGSFYLCSRYFGG